MKTDVKEEIQTALLANSALVAMIGLDSFGNVKIYQLSAPEANKYPRITFFEIENADSQFADDSAYASEVFVQIDVWSKSSTSAISGEVDWAMKGLGFSRYGGADFYETDTKVYHKALRYRRTYEEV